MMGMRAVCTGNGWSPNPADLNCTIGMLLVITGTCQGMIYDIIMCILISNTHSYHTPLY